MSSFADAITQSMITGLDPMNNVVRDYAKQTIETQQLQLIEQKADSISKIERLLADAQSRNADTSIVTSYQKLLAKLTN